MPSAIEPAYLPPSLAANTEIAQAGPQEPAPIQQAPPRPAAPRPAVPKPLVLKPDPPRPPAPKPAAEGGAWRIQLGAFGVKANADGLWAKVRTRPEVAGHPRVDISGTVTRLLAGGYSQSAAQRACAALKAGGLACLVVGP